MHITKLSITAFEQLRMQLRFAYQKAFCISLMHVQPYDAVTGVLDLL